MLSWIWPWAFVLLPLPLLMRVALPPSDSAAGALRVPFYGLVGSLTAPTGQPRPVVRGALLWLLWSALVVAVARPVLYGEPIQLAQDRRDLMLAVDISESMREADMLFDQQYVQRIDAVKYVVGDFVQQRVGDRLGLILFGEQAYLQTPLTHDRNTVAQQLYEAQPGFAGGATAIGDAIGLAVKRLRDRPAESRVLILLTDGANTAGTDPMAGAAVAREAGIRIHTIGVGAEMRLVRGAFGGQRMVPVGNELDEDTLTAIAQQTGGSFFRARNPAELNTIYEKLDALEPIPEEQTFRPQISLTHWILLVALVLSALLFISYQWPFRGVLREVVGDAE
ncbi:hypothetical protein GCM10008090_08260 [Arenicella chitinivorans]|uniref:VWFA domain-containing protein n=1 Tax=Arenicella chitinivorans TaxID=1329800 RepID=A0A918RIN1_9GAMM|nr:VWA domain-containing protein [Arenicella chitinivorans]GHA01466.1 hypothetical protein GCM10008090_08260 [Arenicella chitinivorans]